MSYKQNLHTHSIYCDGKDTMEAMVLAAIDQGFDSLGFSGHSYIEVLKDFSMDPQDVYAYKQEVRRLKEKYGDRIHLLCGLEKDKDTKMDTGGFDYMIGSVHCMELDGKYLFVDWNTDKLRYNVEDVFQGDGLAYARHYYSEVSKIPDTGAVDILGHFDLVTKFCEQCDLFDRFSAEYHTAAAEAIHALAGRVPYFEVNTGAMARGYRSAPYPSQELVREFKRCGFGAVITTDCHDRTLLSYGYEAAKAYLYECGFTHHNVLMPDGFREIPLSE